jgi:chromosome segregation ATPase
MARVKPNAIAMLAAPVEVAAAPALPAAAGAPPTPGPDSAGVFVSPRIIDRAAFGELSAALRTLIDQAAASAEPLRAATEQAARTLAAIQSAADRQQARFDQAERTLASLDGRVRHVEEMLTRATDSAAAVRRFQEKTDELIAARVAQFAARLDAEVCAGATRAAAIEHRAEAAARAVAEKSARAAAALDAGLQRRQAELRALADRARGLAEPGAGGLADAVVRGERLAAAAGEAVDRLDQARREAEEASVGMGESLLAAADEARRLRDEHEHLRAALEEAVPLCRAAQSLMGARAQELRAAMEPAIDELRARADAAAAELRESLAEAQGAGADAAELLVAHRSAAAQISGLLGRLEPWRPLLLEGRGGDEGELPGPITEIIGALRQELARDLGRFAAALHELAARAAAATGDLAGGGV